MDGASFGEICIQIADAIADREALERAGEILWGRLALGLIRSLAGNPTRPG